MIPPPVKWEVEIMKVHLSALGCRLNQSEVDSMAWQFARQGHDVTGAAEGAALLVVNTCAVTQEATRSSRQLIYRLHRDNPTARIAVTAFGDGPRAFSLEASLIISPGLTPSSRAVSSMGLPGS